MIHDFAFVCGCISTTPFSFQTVTQVVIPSRNNNSNVDVDVNSSGSPSFQIHGPPRQSKCPRLHFQKIPKQRWLLNAFGCSCSSSFGFHQRSGPTGSSSFELNINMSMNLKEFQDQNKVVEISLERTTRRLLQDLEAFVAIQAAQDSCHFQEVTQTALKMARHIVQTIAAPSRTPTTDYSPVFLFGVCGGPGSGKSTITHCLTDILNGFYHHLLNLYSQNNNTSFSAPPQKELAYILPMDGYHYYRKQLDQFPDPVMAHVRRGAPYTFDSRRFVEDLRTLKTSAKLSAPTFNHEEKDPKENGVIIDARPPTVEGEVMGWWNLVVTASEQGQGQSEAAAVTLATSTSTKGYKNYYSSVVIVEGNYLLLPDDNWRDIVEILDECWFLNVSSKIAESRVVNRHIQALGISAEEARIRWETNDRINFDLIASHMNKASKIIVP